MAILYGSHHWQYCLKAGDELDATSPLRSRPVPVLVDVELGCYQMPWDASNNAPEPLAPHILSNQAPTIDHHNWQKFMATVTSLQTATDQTKCWPRKRDMAVCQNLVPLVNIKIAGKWMFIPLKMVLIGIDPYPYSNPKKRGRSWWFYPWRNSPTSNLTSQCWMKEPLNTNRPRDKVDADGWLHPY